MSRGQDFANKRAYIDVTAAEMLRPKKGFDYIKYAKIHSTDEEMIRIGDLRGNAVTLNVTGESLETIMMIVCDYVVNGPTGRFVISHIVTDDDKLIKAASLFKEVA